MDFINEKKNAFEVFAFFSCSTVTQLGFKITKFFFNQLVTWYGRKESRNLPPLTIHKSFFSYSDQNAIVYIDKDHFIPFLLLFQKSEPKNADILFLFYFSSFLNMLSYDIEKDCKEVKKWSLYDFSGLLRLFRIKVNLRTWLVRIISITHC